MLVHRVFFWDPNADKAHSGNPLYLHKPQGAGRWDNPDLYDAWYLATSAEGAIGESFGDLETWDEGMFDTGIGMRRALATFQIPDDLALFDFNDPINLVHIGMRPSDVVIRNTPTHQRRAASLFEEKGTDGAPVWRGVQWWSYHHASWTNIMLWSTLTRPAPLTLLRVEDLTLTSPAVVDAAVALHRPLR